MNGEHIRLGGLTKLDCQDLGQAEGITYEKAELEEGAHGEVAVFTVMVSMALISTFAAYLLRKHDRQSFEEDVEVVHADGRIERRHIRWNSQSSEAPDAEIIRQIRGA
jgi:hypothetical protein